MVIPSRAYLSVNALDRFADGTNQWRLFESGNIKQGNESYVMKHSTEHLGCLHVSGVDIHNSIRFSSGAVKQFINPMGTHWKEMSFDYKTQIGEGHPEKLHKLFLAIYNSRVISNSNLIISETIFDATKTMKKTKLNSGWQRHKIDLSKVSTPYLTVLFYVQNFESFSLGKQFWLDNIIILRDPVVNESSYSLPDGSRNKGIPESRKESAEKILGRPYTGLLVNDRDGNNGRG